MISYGKKFAAVIAVVLLAVTVLAVPVSAGRTYQTYTYSIDGNALYSPDAYTPLMAIDSTYMGLEKNLDSPSDLLVDKNDNVYIADKAVLLPAKALRLKWDEMQAAKGGAL